ncbi:hypothetical protein [Lonepinella koalarum]
MNDFYTKLLEEIEFYHPYTIGLERAVYSAQELLNNRKNIDFKLVLQSIHEFIIICNDTIFNNLYLEAKQLVIDKPELANEFFYMDGVNSLDELTREHFETYNYAKYTGKPELSNIEEWDEWQDYKILEYINLNYLDYSNAISIIGKVMPNPEQYEIFAVLVISYIKRAMSYLDKDKQNKRYNKYSSTSKRISFEKYYQINKLNAMVDIINCYNSLDIAKNIKFNLKLQDKENYSVKKSYLIMEEKGE